MLPLDLNLKQNLTLIFLKKKPTEPGDMKILVFPRALSVHGRKYNLQQLKLDIFMNIYCNIIGKTAITFILWLFSVYLTNMIINICWLTSFIIDCLTEKYLIKISWIYQIYIAKKERRKIDLVKLNKFKTFTFTLSEIHMNHK